MVKTRRHLKMNYYLGAAVLLTLVMYIPIASPGHGDTVGNNDFILPWWGGAMVHSNPQLLDYVKLPVPRANVGIVWQRDDLWGEHSGTRGNGVAGNSRIAACGFGAVVGIDNMVIYDYNGTRLWTSGTLLNFWAQASTPMVDVYNRVIACDNRTILMVDPYDGDHDGRIVEWASSMPSGGVPLSPNILNNKTVFLPTLNGPVYIYDARNGSLRAMKYLGDDGQGFYSTLNSACAQGNRMYILTEYQRYNGIPLPYHLSRLYAVDVHAENPNVNNRMSIAWYYQFNGRSQASPTLIGNTLYFDQYMPDQILKDPHLYAVTDRGSYYTVKWKVSYPNQAGFSFSYDPRGGFWYLDFAARKLVRFSTTDGNIMEQIYMDALVQEPGTYYPLSVMTICGNDTRPIMVVSANCFLNKYYVLAIDLVAHNSVLWKVEIPSLLHCNYAGGQYTVLTGAHGPRVVFGAYWGGVIALGTH